MLEWLAKKLATMVAGAVIGSAVTGAKAMYNNDKSFIRLQNILEQAHKNRPNDCVRGNVTRYCPEHAMLAGSYDKKAGGTSNLHIYIFKGFGDKTLQIQFYESTQRIYIWTYNDKGEQDGLDQELDPVEALDMIQKATGVGQTRVSTPAG